MRSLEAALGERAASEEGRKQVDVAYKELVARYPHDAAMRDARGAYRWNGNDREGALRDWQAAGS